MIIRAFALLAALAVSGMAQASLITNGDFEASPLAPGHFGADFATMNSAGRSWDIWSGLPGWSAIGGPGIEVQSNRTLGSIGAQSGSHYLELDRGNSGIAQDVMLEAGSHILSFHFSPRTHDPAVNVIAFGLSGLLPSETIAGPGPLAAVGAWTKIERRFTVTSAGSYRLSFTAAGASRHLGGLLDSVALTRAPLSGPSPTSPVPLPAGMALLGSGAALLAVMRRRQRT